MDSDISSLDCATANQFSLQNFPGENNTNYVLVGQITDSSGGGTRFYLFDVMGKQQVTALVGGKLLGIFSRHHLKLMLSNVITNMIGEDDLDANNT